jgi:hypothetical protein
MLCAANVLSRPCLSWVRILRCANNFGTVGLPQRTDILVMGVARGVRANSRLMRRSKMRLLDHLVGASEAGSAANRGRAPWRSSD